jgi:alanine racemase
MHPPLDTPRDQSHRDDDTPRTEAVIDLDAIKANLAQIKARTSAEVMAIVKADGYGHGLVPAARAAVAGGATWLGTAIVTEAITLREVGLKVPVFAWLWTPGEGSTIRRAITADVDLSISSTWQLAAILSAVAETGCPARIHLKIDTGLSRNGSYFEDWPDLVLAAGKAQAAAAVQVVGVWSHLARADEPGHPTNASQADTFDRAVAVATRAGVNPQIRHLANSAATLTMPDAHFDLVRPGIAIYGLPPVPGEFGLKPAMTLRAAVAGVKRVHAGERVSYGHDYLSSHETTLALVPLGYADGVPRHASDSGPVWINGKRFKISGRVCMDQIVIDVGDLCLEPGASVVLFGPGLDGEPTAEDWARAAGTVSYEIVTRIGPRVRRTYR